MTCSADLRSPPRHRPGTPGHGKNRGSTLIVALGVLFLLSVLAVTFYKVMKLEMKASRNYLDGVKSTLVAKAGLARSIEELRQRAGMSVVTDPGDPTAPWNYEGGAIWTPLEESKNPSLTGSLGASYDAGTDRFRIKVIDAQAQININNNEETIPDILDNLGIAILQLNPRARELRVNPVAIARYGPWSGGRAIIEFRNSMPGRLFKSKSQLKELVANDEAYKVLEPYVTTASWFDPNAVRSVTRDPLRTPTEVEQPPRSPDNPDEVRRAPINVNTAPVEVLAAVIAGVAGRGIFLKPGQITRQRVDEGTKHVNPQPDRQEELSYGLEAHIIYIEPIGLSVSPSSGQRDISVAIAIANRIDEYRRSTDGPFRSYAQLEQFFDMIPANLLPGASSSRASNDVKARVDFQGWYSRAARATLKANFNPNGRISYYNPSQAAFLLVDKGSLIYLPDLNNVASARRMQTLEFCFGSKGIFEVTSLGEIVGDAGIQERVFAQSKLRSVVKLFDSITHTSQRDFEQLDREFQSDREGIETYPENRLFWDYQQPDDLGGVAHDFDGRIELSPFNARADETGTRNDTTWAQFGRLLFENRFEERKMPSGNRQNIRDSFAADVGSLVPWSGGMPTSFQWPFGSMVGPSRVGFVAKTYPWGLLYPDGMYSGEIPGRRGILWFRASFADPQMPPNGDLQGESALTTGNVLPTRGGLEFWYKPDFDWAVRDDRNQIVTTSGTEEPTERFCGLIHASHVYTNNKTDTKTRGTQLYLTRNTRGDLRVTRLYFEIVGDKGNDLPPIADPEPNDQWAVTDIDSYKTAVENDIATPPVYPWPPEEMRDPPAPLSEIKHARTDAFVPFDELKFWRAHEWHHIAVYWDDEYAGNDPQQLIKVFIDGRMVHTNHAMPLAAWTAEEDRLFARLNEPAPISRFIAEKDMRPKDILYIGGFSRLQSIQGGGIFKHAREVDLPAHGTIDDVRMYDGTQVPSRDLNTPERFLPGIGIYSNRFDLTESFPPGFRNIELANVQFTAYLPTSHGAQLRQLGAGKVSVTLNVDGSPVGSLDYTQINSQSDFSVTLGGQKVIIYNNSRVTYDVVMEAAEFGGGFALDTPVLDSVTLTYFLPRTETLLQERIYD